MSKFHVHHRTDEKVKSAGTLCVWSVFPLVSPRLVSSRHCAALRVSPPHTPPSVRPTECSTDRARRRARRKMFEKTTEAFVDDSGAPNVFENDGYIEPTMRDDEALTLRLGGHASASMPAAALWATSTTSTASGSDGAPYNTHASLNHDGSRACVATSSGTVFVVTRERERGGAASVLRVDSGCGDVRECEFGSANDPNSLVLACGDGTARVFDAREGGSRPTAVFRAPFGASEVESATLGGAIGDALVAAAVGPHVAFYDRRMAASGGESAVAILQDAHSEAVTRVRFHPSRRHELYTSSVDGLLCVFDCSKTPLNDEDSLMSIMSADAAINNIGFCRVGIGGSTTNERDAVWCTTGIEEAHVFAASDDRKRLGIQLIHIKNAREQAQRATAESPAASTSAQDFVAQVDYLLGVHDGVAPGELYVSAGTQSGVVGVFPMVQGAPEKIGTADFVRLGAPVAVMRNGHRDIVRSMVWDANANASEAARVPLTCGEDSLICTWTPSSEGSAPPVDRTRPPARRHSPY